MLKICYKMVYGLTKVFPNVKTTSIQFTISNHIFDVVVDVLNVHNWRRVRYLSKILTTLTGDFYTMSAVDIFVEPHENET